MELAEQILKTALGLAEWRDWFDSEDVERAAPIALDAISAASAAATAKERTRAAKIADGWQLRNDGAHVPLWNQACRAISAKIRAGGDEQEGAPQDEKP